MTNRMDKRCANCGLLIRTSAHVCRFPASAPSRSDLLVRALAALETEIALHPYEADVPQSVLSVRDELRAQVEPDERQAERKFTQSINPDPVTAIAKDKR